MPTFRGTLTRVQQTPNVPSDLLMRTTDPNLPQLYLIVPSTLFPQRDRAVATGELTIVTGEDVVLGSGNLPSMRVTAITPAPAPAAPPPPPPALRPPLPPPTTLAPPAIQFPLIGRIRRPPISVPGVTHGLIDRQGRTFLLIAIGENREELDEIEEERDELAEVRGFVERTVQSFPVVRVTNADEFEDEDEDDDNDNDDDNNNNENNNGNGGGAFAFRTPNPTLTQVALPVMQAPPLLLVTGIATPMRPAQQLFFRLMAQRMSMPFGLY